MSAAVATPVTVDTKAPGIPWTRLLRIEMRKMVDTRSGFWLVVAIGLVCVLVTGAMLIWADPRELTFGQIFGMNNIPTGVLLPVLAILLVTSERSQRTGLVTYTLEPRRSRVVSAKLACSLVYAVFAVVVALAFGAIGALLAGAFHGPIPHQWDMTWAGLGNSGMLQLVALLEGFGFAMLIMNSAAAIVGFFALPTIWTLVTNIVPWLHQHIEPWASLNRTEQPFQSGDTVSGSGWAHLGVSVAIWVVLPLLLGLWRLARSEVK
jgi:ABC-type transport system involved in multi-copper enzyme maturation permease subunit